MKKYYVAILLLFVVSVPGIAQNIEVTEFYGTMDIMSVPLQRKDSSGNICALIRISMPNAKINFDSENIIGEVDYDTNEFLLYLKPGSTGFKMKLNNDTEYLINFKDYDISSVEAKKIYFMKVNNDLEGIALSNYAKGMDFNNHQDYIKALPYIRTSAELGYAPAQNTLGAYYAEGYGVHKM